MMELDDVSPGEIDFKEHLFSSDCSVVFLLVVRGQQCVMKVHHGRSPPLPYESKDPRGVCDKGIVPRFLRTMDKFDPKHLGCQPHLKKFLEDEYPPSALFLEASLGIREIHKAGIEHNDIRARNMLVVKEDPDPDRVVWIDFNRANTYDELHMTDKQKERLIGEEESMEGFKMYMDEDVRNGKLDKAYIFYCT